MNKGLENYLELIIPQPLEFDEYIYVFASKPEGIPIQKYVQSFEEVSDLIQKYRYNFNVYIGLATYKPIYSDGNKLKPYRRQCIFLDFDQKDYPDFKDVKDYSNHVKNSFPQLFNHCIVASGSGGYHFYIATQTAPNDEVVEINKAIASITSADKKAANSAQIARLPTTYNNKNPEDKKFVRIINNEITKSSFKRYSIKQLQTIVNFEKRAQEIDIPKQEPPIHKDLNNSKFFCVESMINLGCKKGERNFALGRIVAKLKNDNYTQSKAKEIVLDWNKRCSPPKSINEVESDFKRYWNATNYKLLGCDLPEGKEKNILSNYCDKAQCGRHQNFTIQEDNSNIILIPHMFFDKKTIRKLDGYHYLILLFIATHSVVDKPFFKEFKRKVISVKAVTQKTFTKKMTDLKDSRLVSEDRAHYLTKEYNSNFTSFIKVKLTAIRALLLNKISKTEFLVYLALCVLLQQKNNATYDTIAEYCNLEKSSISVYINNLFKSKVINIEKVYNEKGLYCNRYTFL